VKGRTERHGVGWRYVVDIGDDPATGKRRRKSRSGFAREKDAQTALNAVLVQLAEGRYAAPTATTLRSFILDEWLPSRESRVRASTALSYRQALEGRVLPRIGALELRKLRPRHVSELYADLLANGGRDARRGKVLSARTVRYTGMVLTGALDDAVRLGYMATNPAKLVERPRPRPVEMSTWSAAEARAFLSHVREDRLYGLWVVYLTTGLRRSEALGLRWVTSTSTQAAWQSDAPSSP
jgi:integrase